jgi:hypothetical protein
MAPIKFEENIKDKLEKRTIEPSDKSWSKLSEKLDAHEGKSNNKIVWWIGIAASLVGVFLITTLFFKTGEGEVVLPTLVESPVEDTIEIKESLPEVIENTEKEATANKEVKVNKDPTVLKDKIKKPLIVNNKNNYRSNQNVLTTRSKEESRDNELNSSEVVLKPQKTNGAIAQKNKLEENDTRVIDSEIESLLESAQKELLVNTLKKENTKTVDANSLLEDVETDLEESFRDKVFNTLVSGYNTVKTAVASRND